MRHTWGKSTPYRVVVRKPEGKRPLGRLGHRWQNNIRMDHEETGWKCVDWIDRTEVMDKRRAVVDTVMNLQIS
jgi:hypothetical protein